MLNKIIMERYQPPINTLIINGRSDNLVLAIKANFKKLKIYYSPLRY